MGVAEFFYWALIFALVSIAVDLLTIGIALLIFRFLDRKK